MSQGAARPDGLPVAFERELDPITFHVAVRPVTAADDEAIEALHDRVSGPGRYAKASYRVREAGGGHSPWCRLVLADGQLAAAIRFTPISIGGVAGPLLLGPLAVDPDLKGLGLGKGLVALGLELAAADGVPLVVLVGDPKYYSRLGFILVPAGQITLPGPIDPARLLARELRPGALAAFAGRVGAGR